MGSEGKYFQKNRRKMKENWKKKWMKKNKYIG